MVFSRAQGDDYNPLPNRSVARRHVKMGPNRSTTASSATLTFGLLQVCPSCSHLGQVSVRTSSIRPDFRATKIVASRSDLANRNPLANSPLTVNKGNKGVK